MFDVPPGVYAADGNKWSTDDTLLDALSYGGGKGDAGGARILLRAGVAALLNEASLYRGPGDNQLPSPWLPDGVIGLVNTALALDRDTMIETARVLDDWKNERCVEICEDWPNCPFEE